MPISGIVNYVWIDWIPDFRSVNNNKHFINIIVHLKSFSFHNNMHNMQSTSYI